MEYVIGIDIGTQSTKALMVDTSGAIVAQHLERLIPIRPGRSGPHNGPDVWRDAVTECIAACAAKVREKDRYLIAAVRQCGVDAEGARI